jgi:enediyne biosynthesis protein E4
VNTLLLVGLLGCGGSGSLPGTGDVSPETGGDTATAPPQATGDTSGPGSETGTLPSGTASTGETGAAGTADTGPTGTADTLGETGSAGATGATGSTGHTGTTRDTGGPKWVVVGELSVVAGDPIRCEDPSARMGDHFERIPLGLPTVLERSIWGGGLVVADLDGDGRSEVVVPAGEGTPAVYVDDGAGAFVDEGASWMPGVSLSQPVSGAVADYDGDGDLDLVFSDLALGVVLLRNDGGVFSDVSDGLPALGAGLWQSVSWGDVDLDGDLDLAVAGYGVIPPAPPWLPFGSALLMNEGDGTFSDGSDRLPEDVHEGYTFLLSWLDIDGDGDQDLVAMQDFYYIIEPQVYANVGGVLVDDGPGGLLSHFNSMGLAVADLNGDRLPDMAHTSFQDIALFLSRGSRDRLTGVGYIDWAEAWGIDPVSDVNIFGWGLGLGDLDNDGDLDMPVAMGYWDDFPTLSKPPLELDDQPDVLYLQEEPGVWRDVAGESAWKMDDSTAGRGLALFDLDGDGWLDIVKRQLDAEDLVYRSRCGDGSWVSIELRDAPPNVFGVGARVTVEAGPVVHSGWVSAGSSLYTGVGPTLHFGLGDQERIDRLEVLWPGGEVYEAFDLGVRRRLEVSR